VLTRRGIALHDIEQLRDIAFHSCGVGLIDYFPPAADLDGLSSFVLIFVSLMSSVGRASEAEIAARWRAQTR
jgi:hypothetical protein